MCTIKKCIERKANLLKCVFIIILWFVFFFWNEDSIEKADVISKANKFCGRTDITIQKPSASDVEFSLSGDVQKSGDMEIELKMVNSSEEPRIVEVYMIVVATKYTAVPLIELKDSNSTNVLEPRKGELLCFLLESGYSVNTCTCTCIYLFF